MKIIDVEQNSLDWLMARVGIPTASEFDNLVSPKWEIRKGKMPETYLARKVAEAWLRGPLPGFNTLDMEYGKILEQEAVPFYQFEFSEQIQRVGLVTTDDGRIGCSPDGLIGDEGGLELKCPEAHTHVKYLMEGVVPDDYAAQIQGSLFVTGRKWWKFMSYHRRFPPLVILVEPDPEAQDAIRAALLMFLKRFDAAMDRLTKMNGGTRPGPVAVEPRPEPEEEPIGITP